MITPNTAAKLEAPIHFSFRSRERIAWIPDASDACHLIDRDPQKSVAFNQRAYLRPLVFCGATRVFFPWPLDSRGRSRCRKFVFLEYVPASETRLCDSMTIQPRGPVMERHSGFLPKRSNRKNHLTCDGPVAMQDWNPVRFKHLRDRQVVSRRSHTNGAERAAPAAKTKAPHWGALSTSTSDGGVRP